MRHDAALGHSQNFFKLNRAGLVDWLLDASSIRPGELVLDVGAGPGAIADRLARRGCSVLAIEKDARLARLLRARFAQTPLVRVLEGDALCVALPRGAYKVFANIPFDVTAEWVELFGAALRLMGDGLRWRVAHAESRLHTQHRRLHKVHRTRARLRPPPVAAGAHRLGNGLLASTRR